MYETEEIVFWLVDRLGIWNFTDVRGGEFGKIALGISFE